MIGFGYGLTITRRRNVIVGALDPFAGQLYAASGLARLLSSWGGACCRVRRSSDNAEMDVGFAGPRPDVGPGSEFATWIGSAGASITTLYDQSGSGRHAIQTTGTRQFRLAAAGVVDVGPNGHPVAICDGADDFLEIQDSLAFTRAQPAVTLGAVVMLTTNNTNQSAVYTPRGGSAVQARAALWSQTGYHAVTGRRLDTDAALLVNAAGGGGLYGAGTWRRQIGRLRPVDTLADIATDGIARSAAWHGPGNFADADQAANVTIGGGTSASYMGGALVATVLMQGAHDIAALDVALSQIMP
jgi:hypothetical protein